MFCVCAGSAVDVPKDLVGVIGAAVKKIMQNYKGKWHHLDTSLQLTVYLDQNDTGLWQSGFIALTRG